MTRRRSSNPLPLKKVRKHNYSERRGGVSLIEVEGDKGRKVTRAAVGPSQISEGCNGAGTYHPYWTVLVGPNVLLRKA